MPRALLGSVVVALANLAALLWSGDVRACGGFFCNNVQPVVQSAERILFRINDDHTVTAIVEIQFQGPPGNFGWVLPIPETIDADEVSTAPAGLFDGLERLTAPVFIEGTCDDFGGADGQAYADDAGYAGCGCPLSSPMFGGGGGGLDDGDGFVPDTSGVEVVGDAVVGPYAIEVITAQSSMNLSNWLLINGYQMPQTAVDPMAQYIDAGMSFVGIKLQPDLPAGPIDALELTYSGSIPSIPLLLTAIAASPDMEIIAYVLAGTRTEPGNFADLELDLQHVDWTGAGTTDYELRLMAEVDRAGGRAWRTELAADVEVLLAREPGARVAELLATERYLTRFHTFISPEQMTADPWFTPVVGRPNVDNVTTLYPDHCIDSPPATATNGPSQTTGTGSDSDATGATVSTTTVTPTRSTTRRGVGSGALVLPLLLLVARRNRRRT